MVKSSSTDEGKPETGSHNIRKYISIMELSPMVCKQGMDQSLYPHNR